ncbi:MAG: alkaline phosphatase family protein [Chloroflexi bacterium]|nr:alkaline phosphatase family protein [Chloroflexota bacterium]
MNANVPRKVLVVGIDSTVPGRVYRWAQEGQLPALGQLMQNGVHCSSYYVYLPTVAAANWASLCTGTRPGIHGVTDQVIHVPGSPLDVVYAPPSLDELPVETLAQAAARQGKKSLVLELPAGLPEGADAAKLVKSLQWQLGQLVEDARQQLSAPWSFCFLHLDLLEKAQQALSAEGYAQAELALHQAIDGALGELVQSAGEGSLVVVASTHGLKPPGRPFQVSELLERAGLLAYLPGPDRKVDWARTKVAPVGTAHLFVNLQGRDPQGIVAPEEYAQVVDRTIDVLLQCVDQESGLGPVRVALKREDARVLGVWGDRAGDVVYVLDPRFGGQYGPFLTTARAGDGDLKGMLVMAGPGLKKGEVVRRPLWPADLVPTLCYVAEIEEPRECEGAVIYQALEEPGGLGMQIFNLRSELQRLKRIVDKR